MSTSLTATTTQEVTIKPSVRAKLLRELTVYASLRSELKSIEAKMDKSKAAIEAVREETGEGKLELEGYSITLVAPIRKVFNKKRFIAIGGDYGLYEEAMDNVTSKSYTKVSCPDSKDFE